MSRQAEASYSWRGVTLQLFLLLIFPLGLLLLIIAFGSLSLHQDAMRTMVGERDERAARAAATAISKGLSHRATLIRSLALHLTATQMPDQSLAEFAFLHDTFDGGLALFTADGSLVAPDLLAPAWTEQPLPAELIRLALNGQPQFWLVSLANTGAIPPEPDAEPLVGWGMEQVMLVATRTSGGEFLVIGAFYPARLIHQSIAAPFASYEQGSVLVVDGGGAILFESGQHHGTGSELSNHPGLSNALAGHSGASYLEIDGEERVIAYSPVPPVGWALVIEEPWHAVANPLLQSTMLVPLVLAPLTLLALVALWFGARQIVRPLQALERKATELGRGHFEAIEEPVGGIAEIRHLQDELVHMARQVRLAQASLRGYVGAITAGQEEERRRLARELHDDTIQSLIALNQRVQMAQLTLNGRSDETATALAEVQRLTTHTIEDVRRFTRALRPIYLEDLGLAPALDMLARDTGKALAIPVEFTTSGGQRRLNGEIELAFYRMAQEALSNVSRHAQASQAALRLLFQPNSVILRVEDNGRGFLVPDSPSAMAPEGHFGLLGLYERADLIGATLTIRSAPGQGTQLTVALPLASDL
jgi:signal transduction histidine kinase